MTTKFDTNRIIKSSYSQIKEEIDHFYGIMEDIEDAVYVKHDIENNKEEELLSEDEFKKLISAK